LPEASPYRRVVDGGGLGEGDGGEQVVTLGSTMQPWDVRREMWQSLLDRGVYGLYRFVGENQTSIQAMTMGGDEQVAL